MPIQGVVLFHAVDMFQIQHDCGQDNRITKDCQYKYKKNGIKKCHTINSYPTGGIFVILNGDNYLTITATQYRMQESVKDHCTQRVFFRVCVTALCVAAPSATS